MIQSETTDARGRKVRRVILFAALLVVIFLLAVTAIILAIKISRISSDGKETTSVVPETTARADGYKAFMQDSSKTRSGPLILVNKTHKYTFPESIVGMADMRASRNKHRIKDDVYVYSYQCNYDILMNAEALGAFNAMADAFFNETKCDKAYVTGAYRTEKEQEKKHSDIKAGFSDHHTGYLVAIKFYESDSGKMYKPGEGKYDEEYEWLNNNAHKFGFIVRYPENKASKTGVSGYENAYRYVGPAHAAYIHGNGLCLEEYIELLKSHNFDSEHLKVSADDGKNYEIYRIEASASKQTGIAVPEGRKYDISGDNDGAFIIAAVLD